MRSKCQGIVSSSWLKPESKQSYFLKFSSLPISPDNENIALGFAGMDAIARYY